MSEENEDQVNLFENPSGVIDDSVFYEETSEGDGDTGDGETKGFIQEPEEPEAKADDTQTEGDEPEGTEEAPEGDEKEEEGDGTEQAEKPAEGDAEDSPEPTALEALQAQVEHLTTALNKSYEENMGTQTTQQVQQQAQEVQQPEPPQEPAGPVQYQYEPTREQFDAMRDFESKEGQAAFREVLNGAMAANQQTIAQHLSQVIPNMVSNQYNNMELARKLFEANPELDSPDRSNVVMAAIFEAVNDETNMGLGTNELVKKIKSNYDKKVGIADRFVDAQTRKGRARVHDGRTRGKGVQGSGKGTGGQSARGVTKAPAKKTATEQAIESMRIPQMGGAVKAGDPFEDLVRRRM